MNNYSYNKTISSTECSFNHKMRLDAILVEFQNLATNDSYNLKIDWDSMLKNNNGLWVISKIKFEVISLPTENENITFETRYDNKSPARFYRRYTFYKNNKVMLDGISEWCLVDKDTKKPILLEKVEALKDFTEKSVDYNFTKFRYLTGWEFLNSYKVNLCDIDFNMHTNNVSYAKMVINSFDIESFGSLDIKNVEFLFISQTYYKDQIEIYKLNVNNSILFLGKCNEKDVFIAKIN